jgi:HlyD family secretion protein
MEGVFHRMWRKQRGWVIGAVSICVIAVLLLATRMFGAHNGAGTVSGPAGIPTAEVIRGELVDTVELRGTIKALRTSVLEAPSDSGDIQIVTLAKDGELVHKNDVVAVFDPSTIQNTLAQRKSDMKQAEAQVDDAKAQAHLVEEQDQTDLQKAKYDIRRAELDASQAEILSAIDGEEKKLLLADAQQKAIQAQQKLDSDRANAKANISSIDQKRTKALRDVTMYEDSVGRLTLRAPVDGMVNRLPNWRAGGMFGGSAPPFKEGDRAWARADVLQLPDLTSLLIGARVDESDRGKLLVGQTVTARVDAVPDRDFIGTVQDISPLAKVDFSAGWPPAKNFDLAVVLEHPDPRLRPGMSVSERIAVQHFPNVILVPSEAVLTKNGRNIVYVMQGSKTSDNFEERVVTIGHRSGGQVEIRSGLKPGERVALKDPSATAAKP